MMQQRPFLIPFLAMAFGLVVADRTGLLVTVSVPAALLICLVLSCRINIRLPFAICSSLFFFSCGLSALSPWRAPPPTHKSIAALSTGIPVIVEGIVRSRPVVTTNGTRIMVRTERVFHEKQSVAVSGDMLLRIAEGQVSVSRGDRIRFTTRVTIPRRLGLPGEFDYPRYLAYHGVTVLGRVADSADIVLVRGAAEDSVLRRIDQASAGLGDFIRSTISDEKLSSVLTALLLGDQKRIPEELSDAYTRAGVNHILSISGFHVGIIAYFVVMTALMIATRIEYLALHFNLRRTILLLSLPAMLLYLFLTGAAPATARSVIMLAAFILALYAERETDPVNVLLMAACLLVFLDPPTLFDISFQLSFIALWGLIIFVSPVMRLVETVENRLLRSLIQFVAASCAATLVTIIPVLFTFNVASLNGIFSNFLIVPLLGYGAVLAGFCALPLVYVFSPAALVLLWVAARMVEVSNWLIIRFAQLPVVEFRGITWLDMALFLTGMCCVTFIRSFRLKASLCCILPVIAIAVHAAAPSGGDGRLQITMLSVGQAESILVKLPEGGTMLIDGGGYLQDTGHDFGERILAPALSKLGVRRIDHLILTHSHPDHAGGLAHIARSLPVGEFMEAYPGGDGEHYQLLKAALISARTPSRQLACGDSFVPGGDVHIQILSPCRSDRGDGGPDNETGMNDDSLVFRLSYGSFSMLFTADAGFPTESRILAHGYPVRSTVLKVGHHGSRFSTSDAFLNTVAPEAALISAGRGNSFGLPSPETVRKLERAGIWTYRTDRDGTLELTSDGVSWRIDTPYREQL